MQRAKKETVVQEIQEKLSGSKGYFLFEYHGLNVADVTGLRRKLRERGGELKVYKNTLLKKALKGVEADLKGPLACAFAYTDVVPTAKTLVEFEKEEKPLTIKTGVLGDKVISLNEIKQLAKLPSRDVLLAQWVGAFSAPIRAWVNVLSAVPRNFVYALKAIEQSKINKE